MAEVVQYHLEQMLGELEDLERRKLFTKPELKTIVKKRTKFEYGLRRRRVGRADFLRYIEYEINVDTLRRKRKNRASAPLKDQQGSKRTLSDYSIGRRIVSIFERALTRHPNDVALWLQYIEFVRASDHSEDGEASTRALSKIYAAAITRHPYEARLWIMAAAHELDASSNGGAARLLLQRALRVNPTDRALWLEYFRLELLLVEKIKARRRVLGIDGERAEAEAEESEREEEEGGVIALPALDEEAEFDQRVEDQAMAKYAAVRGGGSASAAASALTSEQRAAQESAYMQGAVAVIVFDQAIRAIPTDWRFRREFASVAAAAGGSSSPAVIQHVLDSIGADFAGDAEARAFLCEAPLAAVDARSPALVDALRQAVANYAQAVADVDAPAMWAEYARFLAQWRASDACDDANLSAYFAALQARAAARVADDAGARMTEALALALADAAADRAAWLAAATARFPQSEALWVARVGGAIASGGGGDPDLIERLVEAQALVAAPHARGVWDLWLAWVERALPPARVQAKYLAAFARTAQLAAQQQHAPLKAHVQIRFVEWAAALPLSVTLAEEATDDEDDEDEATSDEVSEEMRGGGLNVDALRHAYRGVMRHAFPTPAFYARCLALEPDARHKTMLHEMACRVDEGATAPWLAYLQFLIGERRLDAAAAVFWRASKALPSDDAREAFDAEYQTLLTRK
ncbi:U3 snoRNP protein [Coemansia sp. RSA 2681]|nr:U3 snoRNP protein [Coemansia sp. RSA 2681]